MCLSLTHCFHRYREAALQNVKVLAVIPADARMNAEATGLLFDLIADAHLPSLFPREEWDVLLNEVMATTLRGASDSDSRDFARRVLSSRIQSNLHVAFIGSAAATRELQRISPALMELCYMYSLVSPTKDTQMASAERILMTAVPDPATRKSIVSLFAELRELALTKTPEVAVSVPTVTWATKMY